MTSSISREHAFPSRVSPLHESMPQRRKPSARNPIPASFLIPNGDLVPTDSVSNAQEPAKVKPVVKSSSTKSNQDYGSSPLSTYRSKLARSTFSRAASALGLDRIAELNFDGAETMFPQGTEPLNTKSIVKAGWLWRRGSMLQWRRFYVRAYSNGMTAGSMDFSLNGQGTAVPIKSLDLAICTQVIEKPAKSASTRFEFQLLLGKSDLLLAADSIAECNAWISSIHTLIPRIVQPGLARIGAELDGATATVAHLSNERSEMVAQNLLLQNKITELEEQLRIARSEAVVARKEQRLESETCRKESDNVARELALRIEAQNHCTEIINREAEKTRSALSMAHEDLSDRQAEIASAISALQAAVEVSQTGDLVSKQVAETVVELVKKIMDKESSQSDRMNASLNRIGSSIEDAVQKSLSKGSHNVSNTVQDALIPPIIKIQKQNHEILDSIATMTRQALGSNNNLKATDSKMLIEAINSANKELIEVINAKLDRFVASTSIDTLTEDISTTVSSNVAKLISDNHSDVENVKQLLEKILRLPTPNLSDEVMERISSILQCTENSLNNKIDKISFESTHAQLTGISDQLESLATIINNMSKRPIQQLGSNDPMLHTGTDSSTKTVWQLLQNLDKKVNRTHENDHRLLLSIEERLDRLVHSTETLKRIDSLHTDKLNKGLTLLEESKQANGWSGRSHWRSAFDTLEGKLDKVLEGLQRQSNSKEPIPIRHIDSGNFPCATDLCQDQTSLLESQKTILESEVVTLSHQVDKLSHSVEELSAQRYFLIQEIRSHSHLHDNVITARKELNTIMAEFASFEAVTIARVQKLASDAQELELNQGVSLS